MCSPVWVSCAQIAVCRFSNFCKLFLLVYFVILLSFFSIPFIFEVVVVVSVECVCAFMIYVLLMFCW